MKHITPVLLFTTLVTFGFISLDQENGIRQRIQKLLDRYSAKNTQERLYVHIDNNLVEPGSSIWMKAYVIEQNTQQLSTQSRVLYTDILTYQGDRVLGYKFLLDSGVVDGAISIPDSIKYENYVFSAYTQEMKEKGEAFTQVIEIRSYKSLFKKCELSFDKDSYNSGDPMDIRIRTMDVNSKPVGKVKYEYKLYNQDVVVAQGSGRSDKVGEARHRLALDRNQFIQRPVIEVTTTFEENNSNFYFIVPTGVKKELVVSFSPEGKKFLAGVDNRIGIRTTDMEGVPVNFRGEIMDDSDRWVAEVVVQTNGIGTVQFVPRQGKSYYLKIPGLDKTYDLPKVESQGYRMILDGETDEELVFRIARSPQADALVYVALIQSGKVNYFTSLDLKDEKELKVSTKDLPIGIAEICLFDRSGTRLIDRPVFINDRKSIDFELSFSDNYEKAGELVELTIKAKDYQGNPIAGEFSLSVNEDFSVFHKTFKQSNIISSLLLESSVSSRLLNQPSFLAGDIFNSGNINDALLVLDYKKGRWNSPDADGNEPSDLAGEKEFLRGVVLDKDNVPQGGVEIIAIVKGSWDRSIITSDKFGFFDLPISLLSKENRGFVIGLGDDQNAKNLKIKIKDVEYVPKTIEGLSFPLLMAEQEVLDGKEGFENATVLSTLLIEDENYVEEFLSKKVANYGSFTSTIRQGEQLRQAQDFLGILRQVTSVAYVDKPNLGNVVFRGIPKVAGSTFGGGGYPALFVLDGVPIGNNYHDLDFLRVEHIKSIKVIRSSAAVINYGTRAGGGVIVVNTGTSGPTASQQYFTQQKLEQNLLNEFKRAVSVDFFEPDRSFTQMDTTDISMLKTTLFWTPNLIFDKNGETKIKYKNMGLPSKIMIRLNGISDTNQMGFEERTYFTNF